MAVVIRGTAGIAMGGVDDVKIPFGTGDPACISWETSDANAHHLKLDLPAGGSVDVPIFSIGIGTYGVDLTIFNGLTQPGFAVMDADRDSAALLTFAADDVAAITVLGTAAALRITGADVFLANAFGMVIGANAQITAGAAAEFQVLGSALADSSMVLGAFSADAVGPEIMFVKSRHATVGSNTIVNDNDVVGRIVWYPADGADFATEAAVFQAEVDDASAAAGDVGMAFVWRAMPGGAGAIADVLRLSAAGDLTPGVSDQGGLGTATLMWGDLFLASGAVINFNNGDITLTHSSNLLELGGGSFGTTGSNYTAMQLRSLSDTAGNRAVLKFERGKAGPAAIDAADFLIGEFAFAGYDGTGYDDAAAIVVWSAEDFTATEHGTFMEFKTTTIGAATTSTKWTIENDGQLTNDGGGPLVMGGAYIQFTEMAAPGALGANTAGIYALEGAGDALTDLCAVFQDATVVVFAEESTDPDAPILRYPDGTPLTCVLRKRHPGEIQIMAVFPDGTEWPLGNQTLFYNEEKVAMNKGAKVKNVPTGWYDKPVAQPVET
jgi:hypothetical protein